MKNVAPILKVAGIALLFVGAMWLADQVKGSAAVQELVQRFSYGGVFLLAFVSGFNVIVPVPAMSFLPVFTEAGLDTWRIVATVSLGMTCGDAVGFLLGTYGRKAVTRVSVPAWIRKLEAAFQRHPLGLPLFLFLYAAFVPLPNELAVIPAAASGLKWQMVLVPVLLGNVVLNSLMALGVSSVFG